MAQGVGPEVLKSVVVQAQMCLPLTSELIEVQRMAALGQAIWASVRLQWVAA